MKNNTRGVGHSKKIIEEADVYFVETLLDSDVYKLTKSRLLEVQTYFSTEDVVRRLNSDRKVAFEKGTSVYANYDLSHHEKPKRAVAAKPEWA